MTISDALLPEFDQEMANTRKTIERVPDEKFGWKPHEKSFPMGNLVGHLTNLAGWASTAINQDSLDLAPDGVPLTVPPINSTAEALAAFDKNAAAARDAIASASDEKLFQPWTLMKNGTTLMSLPRVVVIRSFVMNHMIHHRAQLGVYLRLNDIPVPSIYGPSADEGSGF
jgi:uncharacterized damage-inducible protein DinB